MNASRSFFFIIPQYESFVNRLPVFDTYRILIGKKRKKISNIHTQFTILGYTLDKYMGKYPLPYQNKEEIYDVLLPQEKEEE
jgi:hypothetical protein